MLFFFFDCSNAFEQSCCCFSIWGTTCSPNGAHSIIYFFLTVVVFKVFVVVDFFFWELFSLVSRGQVEISFYISQKASFIWKRKGRNSKIWQLCQHCCVNTRAAPLHLRVLVNAVTHQCLMKLENTENDKSWHCRGISAVWHWGGAGTNCCSLHMQTHLTKAEEWKCWPDGINSPIEVSVLQILSDYPNLHRLLFICDRGERGLCINYSPFSRSAPRPQDLGNYSSAQ